MRTYESSRPRDEVRSLVVAVRNACAWAEEDIPPARKILLALLSRREPSDAMLTCPLVWKRVSSPSILAHGQGIVSMAHPKEGRRYVFVFHQDGATYAVNANLMSNIVEPILPNIFPSPETRDVAFRVT